MSKVPVATGLKASLAPIGLARDTREVLARAAAAARRVCNADSAFAAVRASGGMYPIDPHLAVGLTDPDWPSVEIRPACGIGGQVLADGRPRTSDNYLDDPTITRDYVPIMQRENLRGLVVAAVQDLSAQAASPAALIYASTQAEGAPGDRAVCELLHIAEMAAVGLAHVRECRPTFTEAAERGLSPRELEILCLLGEGASNRDIAERLVIAEPTVKGHLRSIFRKLDCGSRLAAVATARQRGLL